METFSFEKLIAYQKSLDLIEKAYRLLEFFPNEEKYALCNQIRRSVVSVSSNIAEQSGRRSSKEKIHFLEIAFGSLMECYCQMQIATRLGYIAEKNFSEIKPAFFELSRLLSGLTKAQDNENPKEK